MRAFYFLLMSMYFTTTQAAPLPATSSSMILSQKKGLFLSEHGFRIHSENTMWRHVGTPFENPNILTMYKSPQTAQGSQAALTIRIDKLGKKNNLKNYIKHWKKDYVRFGFTILNRKKVKINNEKAYLLDLSNSNSQKQLRQILFVKNKKVVILTCRGQKINFSSTVKSCNHFFRNFSWL